MILLSYNTLIYRDDQTFLLVGDHNNNMKDKSRYKEWASMWTYIKKWSLAHYMLKIMHGISVMQFVHLTSFLQLLLKH